MTLKTIFHLCRKMCDKKAEQKPNSGFVVEGKKVSYSDLSHELAKLQDWCYPTDTTQLRIHLCCRDCEHYKKFKHVNSKYDRKPILLCELDKKPKDKDHYCGYACPRKSGVSVDGMEAISNEES